MSLLDEAKQESAQNRGPACTISRLEPEIRAEIDEALAHPGVTAAAVERVLAKREITVDGRPIKESTLGRHRRGGCTCEPG